MMSHQFPSLCPKIVSLHHPTLHAHDSHLPPRRCNPRYPPCAPPRTSRTSRHHPTFSPTDPSESLRRLFRQQPRLRITFCCSAAAALLDLFRTHLTICLFPHQVRLRLGLVVDVRDVSTCPPYRELGMWTSPSGTVAGFSHNLNHAD